MLELVYPPYLLYFSFWARSDSTHGAHSYSTEVRGRKKKHPRQEPQGLAQEQGRRVHQRWQQTSNWFILSRCKGCLGCHLISLRAQYRVCGAADARLKRQLNDIVRAIGSPSTWDKTSHTTCKQAALLPALFSSSIFFAITSYQMLENCIPKNASDAWVDFCPIRYKL